MCTLFLTLRCLISWVITLQTRQLGLLLTLIPKTPLWCVIGFRRHHSELVLTGVAKTVRAFPLLKADNGLRGDFPANSTCPPAGAAHRVACHTGASVPDSARMMCRIRWRVCLTHAFNVCATVLVIPSPHAPAAHGTA